MVLSHREDRSFRRSARDRHPNLTSGSGFDRRCAGDENPAERRASRARFARSFAVVGALAASVILQTPARAFTIDFSGFDLGPLPPTVATPWGDFAFPGGFVRDDPLNPGTGPRMAYGFSGRDGAVLPGEIGPLTLLLPPGGQLFELTFDLINLNPETRSLEGIWVDAAGFFLGDFGIVIPAESTRQYTDSFSFDDQAGISFFGVTDDLTGSDRCAFSDSTCNDLWGILSIEITVVPEPSTATLVAAGLVGVAMRRRSTARPAI